MGHGVRLDKVRMVAAVNPRPADYRPTAAEKLIFILFFKDFDGEAAWEARLWGAG